jgi:hypothetical protein
MYDKWTADADKVIYRNGKVATDKDLKDLFNQAKGLEGSGSIYNAGDNCTDGHFFMINEDNPEDSLTCVNCSMPFSSYKKEN